MWAVLTSDDKRGNRWDPEAFLATGEADVEEIMGRIAEHSSASGWAVALDFGCGVGRLSQALAGHFDSVYAVDISPTMIERARQTNRFEHCEYHLNAAPDLSLLTDESVDLVVSLHVLQHMRPSAARRYLLEMHRVLRPGGHLALHLPTRPVGWSGAVRGSLRNRAVRARPRLLGVPGMEMHGWRSEKLGRLLRNRGMQLCHTVDRAGEHWKARDYLWVKSPDS